MTDVPDLDYREITRRRVEVKFRADLEAGTLAVTFIQDGARQFIDIHRLADLDQGETSLFLDAKAVEYGGEVFVIVE